jgi:hypothetical protein
MQESPLHPLQRPYSDPVELSLAEKLHKQFKFTDEDLQALRAGQLPQPMRRQLRNRSLYSFLAILVGFFILRAAEYRQQPDKLGNYIVVILIFGVIFTIGNWLYFAYRWRNGGVTATAGQLQYEPQKGASKYLAGERKAFIGGETLKVEADIAKHLPDGAWMRVFSFANSKKIFAAEAMTEDEIAVIEQRREAYRQAAAKRQAAGVIERTTP